ncbi:MAG: sigma-54 interaction domain-containing protein, partial [Spirochaetaceae bacterium]
TAAWINAGSRPIVGSSPLFSVLLEQARQVARYDVSILVRGETGTGKNLLARYIHEASPRAGGPFLELNCSAVTASLAESELFGHLSGAYTGATRDRLGTFRSADGGSIFLDEIGDLPLELQPKLLRVLEEKVVLPVGSDTPVAVDVRVIAATNRSLEAMIDAGTFRRDLYERLKQVPLELPPLRLRRDDIAPLVSTFVERWNHRYHEAKRFEPRALQALETYDWPGNVRELENIVTNLCASSLENTIPEAAVARALSRPAAADSSWESGGQTLPEDGIDLRAHLTNLERALYVEALRRTDGNAERAARLLGIPGHTFRKAWRERLGGGVQNGD